MEATASYMFPWVTGNTAGDPECSHSQLLCSLSNLMGGIISSSHGRTHRARTQSLLITNTFADWAPLALRPVSLIKLTDRRNSKWNSAKHGEKHYVRNQMCKGKWRYVGRRHHYRKKSGCLGSNIEILKLSWLDSTVLHTVLTHIFFYVKNRE